VPPPLDRFLSYHVRPQKQPDPAERQRLTAWMFATQRFGALALFCQWLLLDAARRDTFLEAPTDDVLRVFEAEVPGPVELFGILRSVDQDVFIGWVRQLSGHAPAPAYMGRFSPRILAALERCGTARARLLRAGVPPWFAPALELRERFGGLDTTALLAAQNTAPPLWLRPRPGTEAAARLTAEGFEVTETHGALRVSGAKSLFTTEAHREGLFEVQDLGSQLAGARVECRPGDFVWDACAGAGGKTLQIAATLRDKGVVHASDIRADKLDTLRMRVRRAGVSNVRTLPFDGHATPEFAAEVRTHGGFDWVLVDAPCSSSGTWRRNPDARLRNTPAELRDTVRTQIRLLALAAKAVRPGGHLVYLTCSWLVEEDEDIADRFSAEHPGFERLSQGFHGCPTVDADTLFGATWVRRA
jgi:16S rRNA (cytosine967-C5)-methyltransferase